MRIYLFAAIAAMTSLLSHSVLSEPLYWHASKGNKEYLILGSIHMGVPDMYPMPSKVIEFLDNSDGLITEIKLSDSSAINLPKASSLTQTVLTPKEKLSLENINTQLGFPKDLFLTSPAWQTAMTLQISQFAKIGFTSELGIDQYFTEQAQQKNRAIFGLETMAFQLGLFTEIPQIGPLLLKDTIANWSQYESLSLCLAKAWSAGDQEYLTKLSTESQTDKKVTEVFVTKRNHDWANKLDSAQFLADGRYLVVVGALHLVGEQNLISLLNDQGFKTRQLSKSKKVDCQ